MFTTAPAVRSTPTHVVHCVSYHEWVELYNGGPTAIRLSGSRIKDALDHSFALCVASIAPGDFLFCDGNFSLKNGGDTVKLVDDSDNFIQCTYPATGYDISWSRTVDGAGTWIDTYPPRPGGSNQAAADIPTMASLARTSSV